MGLPGWTLTEGERVVLAAALDALLPPGGGFPPPSRTGLIDGFIIPRVPPPGTRPRPYPGIAAGLAALEREQPEAFLALWRLAVYGYYSRPEVIAAIQRELAPAYHGAPLPLGYAHAIAPWDPADPLHNPRNGRGSYLPTDAIRRVDLAGLPRDEEDQ